MKTSCKLLAMMAILVMASILPVTGITQSQTDAVSEDGVLLKPSIFESKDDTGYGLDQSNLVSQSVIGGSGYQVSLHSDDESTHSDSGKHVTFASKGNVKVSVKSLIPVEGEINGSGWHLSWDTYGKHTDETVCGDHYFGEVKNGKIALQYLTNGNWMNVCPVMDLVDSTVEIPSSYINKGTEMRIVILNEYRQPYSYQERYWTTEDIILASLTIWGALIVGEGSGVRTVESNHFVNVAEVFNFKVCSSNSGSLRIVNLNSQTTDENLSSMETMVDGSMTAEGFWIDCSVNPHLDITVYKDGAKTSDPYNWYQLYQLYLVYLKCPPNLWKYIDFTHYKDPGTYTIRSQSSSGDVTEIEVYVTDEGKLRDVFESHPFTVTEEAFSEGDHRTFVGNVTIDGPEHVEGMPDPEYKWYSESGCVDVRPGDIISGEGFHEVVATIGNPNSGDIYSVRYGFNIVDEAPGPVMNHRNLILTSAVIPECAWAFTLPSAGSQDITFIYETEEAATEALVGYEYSRVIYMDGITSWGPEGMGSNRIDPVDLDDVISEYAREKIDLIVLDPSTVVALNVDDIGDILSCIIDYPVMVKGMGQFADLEDTPVIGGIRKVVDGEDGTYNDVRIISDFILLNAGGKGLDSHRATAFDGNRTINIEFGVGLAQQLRDAGMRGLIHITEMNVYNRITEYDIWMASEDDVCFNMNHSGTVTEITGKASLDCHMPFISSVDCDIGCFFTVYPKNRIQDSVTLNGECVGDFVFKEGETYVIEVTSAAGLGYDVTIRVHQMNPTCVWSPDRSMAEITFSCADGCGHASSIEVDSTKRLISKATCMKAAIHEYEVSGSHLGVDFSFRYTTTTGTASGHDYRVSYSWTEDGNSVEIDFQCRNNAEHCGTITLSNDEIVKRKVEGGYEHTVQGVYDGVSVYSKHLVASSGEDPGIPGDTIPWVAIIGIMAFIGIIIGRRVRHG